MAFLSFPPPCTALHSDSALFYLSSCLFGCQETYHQRVVDHNTHGKKKTRNFLQQNARPIANALAHTNEPETSCIRKCMLHRMPGHINWLTDITATMGSSTRSTKPQISGTLPVQRFLPEFFFFAKTRRTVLLHEQPKSETTHKSSCELEHKLTSSQHHESLLLDSFLKIIIREATEHRHLSIFVLTHLQTRVFLNAAVSVPRMPCPGHDLGKTKPKILATQMLLLVQF